MATNIPSVYVVMGKNNPAYAASHTKIVYDEDRGQMLNTTLTSLIQSIGSHDTVPSSIGEVVFFTDSKVRDGYIMADGSLIDPQLYPEFAAYAAEAGWELDSSTQQYKTPNLSGTINITSDTNNTFTLYPQFQAKVIKVATMEVAATSDDGGAVLNYDQIYPVGSYIMTSDAEFDPNVKFGGTWVNLDSSVTLTDKSITVPVILAEGETVDGPIGPEITVYVWHKTAPGGSSSGKNPDGTVYTGKIYTNTDGKDYPIMEKTFHIEAGPSAGQSITTQLGIENVLKVVGMDAIWENDYGTYRAGTIYIDSTGPLGEIAASTAQFNINSLNNKDLTQISVTVTIRVIISGTEVTV